MSAKVLVEVILSDPLGSPHTWQCSLSSPFYSSLSLPLLYLHHLFLLYFSTLLPPTFYSFLLFSPLLSAPLLSSPLTLPHLPHIAHTIPYRRHHFIIALCYFLYSTSLYEVVSLTTCGENTLLSTPYCCHV